MSAPPTASVPPVGSDTSTPRARSGPRTSVIKRIVGRDPIGTLLSAPYALFLAAVFVYPLGLGIWIAFHKYSFSAPGAAVDRPFVGFDNFARALADPAVLSSFTHVGIFLVINVPLTIGLALLLAAALNSAMKGVTFFRVAYYVPYVTASVATVTVWLFMFSERGVVNKLLGGLAPDPSWLTNSGWAMPMIALYVLSLIHISEPTRLGMISYAVFCLKKKKNKS